MLASRPVARAVAIGCRRGGGLIHWAISGPWARCYATLDVKTAPRGRRNFFTRVSHEAATTPAMTDETSTRDLKASEDAEAFHLLRSIEATLDEIARDIAEMKAEAQQFLPPRSRADNETAPLGGRCGKTHARR